MLRPSSSLANTAQLDGFDHPTLTDRIYVVIKDGIISQEFKPGTRLIDQEIAERLGVSRTPVREAIARLAADGLVTMIPRRGAFVVQLSIKDIEDVYDVREALEGLAVELAVQRLSDDDLMSLRDLLDQATAALGNNELSLCFDLDRQFHDTLVQLSDNGRLVEFNRILSGSIQVSRWWHCRDHMRAELSLREHWGVFEALKQRNAARASQAIREHIKNVRIELLSTVKDSAAEQL